MVPAFAIVGFGASHWEAPAVKASDQWDAKPHHISAPFRVTDWDADFI